MSWILAIFAFGLLIGFHELGHMWVAKRVGMLVPRFSWGFGPVLFSWKRGDTEYAVSALPLGGYVQIAGMAEGDDIAPADPRSYQNRPAWARAAVLLAGPGANYLLAFLIGVPLLMFANVRPDLGSTRIGSVGEGSPAAVAGMKSGDVVRVVGTTEVRTWDAMRAAINETATGAAGGPVAVVVERGPDRVPLQLTPKDAGSGRFQIGVSPADLVEPGLPLHTAIVDAANNLWLQSASTVALLGNMVTGKQKADLSGPLGILSHTAEQAKKGFSSFVQTVWLLSVAIGLFNILPLPALDGGRLVFIAFEAISRRPVNQKIEGWIHTAGMVGLLVLMVVVTYGDIVKKFSAH